MTGIRHQSKIQLRTVGWIKYHRLLLLPLNSHLFSPVFGSTSLMLYLTLSLAKAQQPRWSFHRCFFSGSDFGWHTRNRSQKLLPAVSTQWENNPWKPLPDPGLHMGFFSTLPIIHFWWRSFYLKFKNMGESSLLSLLSPSIHYLDGDSWILSPDLHTNLSYVRAGTASVWCLMSDGSDEADDQLVFQVWEGQSWAQPSLYNRPDRKIGNVQQCFFNILYLIDTLCN